MECFLEKGHLDSRSYSLIFPSLSTWLCWEQLSSTLLLCISRPESFGPLMDTCNILSQSASLPRIFQHGTQWNLSTVFVFCLLVEEKQQSVTLTCSGRSRDKALEEMLPSIQASGFVATCNICAATSLFLCFMRLSGILIKTSLFFSKASLSWLCFPCSHKNPSWYKELLRQREGERCFRGPQVQRLTNIKKHGLCREIVQYYLNIKWEKECQEMRSKSVILRSLIAGSERL